MKTLTEISLAETTTWNDHAYIASVVKLQGFIICTVSGRDYRVTK